MLYKVLYKVNTHEFVPKIKRRLYYQPPPPPPPPPPPEDPPPLEPPELELDPAEYEDACEKLDTVDANAAALNALVPVYQLG